MISNISHLSHLYFSWELHKKNKLNKTKGEKYLIENIYFSLNTMNLKLKS